MIIIDLPYSKYKYLMILDQNLTKFAYKWSTFCITREELIINDLCYLRLLNMKQTNENPRATTNPGFSKVGFSVDNPQTNKNIAKDNKIAANIFPIILIQSQSTNFIIDPFTEIKLS